jgi:hypothetical protein
LRPIATSSVFLCPRARSPPFAPSCAYYHLGLPLKRFHRLSSPLTPTYWLAPQRNHVRLATVSHKLSDFLSHPRSLDSTLPHDGQFQRFEAELPTKNGRRKSEWNFTALRSCGSRLQSVVLGYNALAIGQVEWPLARAYRQRSEKLDPFPKAIDVPRKQFIARTIPTNVAGLGSVVAQLRSSAAFAHAESKFRNVQHRICTHIPLPGGPTAASRHSRHPIARRDPRLRFIKLSPRNGVGRDVVHYRDALGQARSCIVEIVPRR